MRLIKYWDRINQKGGRRTLVDHVVYYAVFVIFVLGAAFWIIGSGCTPPEPGWGP